MANARLLVEIAATSATFQADLGKAAAIADSHARKIQRSLEKIKDNAKDLGRAIIGAFGFTLGIEGIIRAFESIGEKALEESRTINQLNAVLIATGGAAGITASGLEKLNRQVQGASIFDDEVIRKAETALLRFRTVQGDVFRDAIRLTPDVAAALGMDLPAAATALGRALSGDGVSGMKALKGAGLALSEQQIDLAARMSETGDVAGAQRIKLEELRKSVAGAGEADTKGLYGATKLLGRAFDDLQKSFGKKVLGDNSATISVLTVVFEKLAHAIDGADLNLVKILARFNTAPAAALDVVSKIAEAAGGGGGSRFAKGKISGQQEADEVAATMAQLGQLQKEIDEKRYVQTKLNLQKRADAAATFSAGELQLQRSTIALELDQQQTGYERGLVSVTDFYDTQHRLAKENLNATTNDLNNQISAFEDLQRAVIPGTNQPMFDQAERADAFKKETALVNQANAARYAFALQNQQLMNKEIDDVRKLQDEYDTLREKVMAASGDSVGSATLGFDIANSELRDRAKANLRSSDPLVRGLAEGTLANNDALRAQIKLQAELSKAQKDFGGTMEDIATAQGHIDVLRATGDITELDSINRKSELTKSYIGILEQQAAAYEKVAAALPVGDTQDQALRNARRLRLEIEQLAASSDLLTAKFRNIFEDGFATAFTDIITGAKSVKDAFRDMERSIVQSISRIAAQNIAESIFGKSGAGGFLPGLLAKFFGGVGGSSGGADLSGYNFGGGYASGTDFARGGPVMVGERGPEIVNLPRGSRVTPNNKIGGNVINISVAVDGATSRATADQIATRTGAAVRRAMARNS